MERAQFLHTLSNRKRKAASTIIGAILVLGMMVVIGYSYFLYVTQDFQASTRTTLLSNSNALQQAREQLTITGTVNGPVLGFIVNNTGISVTITSFFVVDSGTGQVLQFNSGSASSPALPYAVAQGKSTVFSTAILYTPGHSYVFKAITARGSTFVGTYPGKQLNAVIVGSLVAAGLGFASMIFSSFSFYNLSSGVIDVAHPHSGNIVPYGVTPAFSMEITNNDPNAGTIVLDSHSNIYLYNSCPSGCGANVPVFVYYIVNVAPNGTITSAAKGSYVPIHIPYGKNQTLYFASANDTAMGSFSPVQLIGVGQKVPLGEYDVFLILSGTDSQAQRTVMYSQNLPFAGMFLADNVAWLSETPNNCSNSISNPFSLAVTNALKSTGAISQVTVNAPGFSSISVSNPSGWKHTLSGNVITWTVNANLNGQAIAQGTTVSFPWSGIANTAVGSIDVVTISLTFSSGTVIVEPAANGCLVN